ncbi:MAG: hypothetical protein M3159_04420 [Actinomycetota bacterium]|nr:hypothetical protein [Actinomycetota bacterium]
MLRSLSRLALGKGLFGGSRPWLAVGVAATALRVLVKMAKKEPEVVYRENLEAGHSMVISHFGSDKA